MQIRDYFTIALAFLIATIIMDLILFSWFPNDSIILGYVNGHTIVMNRWFIRTLLLLPFSLFLSFATVGVIIAASKALWKWLTEPRPAPSSPNAETN